MNAVAGRSGGERLRGNFDTSAPDGGPQKPKGMPEHQSQAWDELIEQLPVDALRKRDVHLLYELAGYVAALRQINWKWLAEPEDKDLRCAKTQYTEKVRQLSALFGLSPADRKRIQIDKPLEEKDDLEEFTD